MATRSTIALEFEDGTVKQVYAHWDGYIEGNGSILLHNYKTPAEVAELLNMGDMSSLDENVEKTTFYGRDRGESGIDARRFSSYDDYKRNGDFESYNYIMREGIWYVDRGNGGSLIPLVEAFKLLER